MSALARGSDTRDQGLLRLEEAEREYVHALYLAHARALRGYAVRLGFPGEAADDLLQETFLAAIRRVDALKQCREPRAYLLQILRNVIGSRLRSRKTAERILDRFRDPEDETIGQGYRDELAPEILLKGLIGDEELRLLLRFYQEGRSVKELAGELGIDPGACYMRLKRAREHLRAALAKEDLL